MIKYAFFGSSEFSVIVLNELEKTELLPSLIITTPNKPKGRKMIITPTPVKMWAEKRKIPTETPLKLNIEFTNKMKEEKWDFFAVASYGKIITKDVLEIPKNGSLNVHPSLLPKYRGASPLQSMILSDDKDNLGVTIMLMDEEMDHGPILSQKRYSSLKWPVKLIELKNALGALGGELIAEIMEDWSKGIEKKEQDHSKATFTKKITKDDGLLNLKADHKKIFLKFCAFSEWPKAYFFINDGKKEIRIIVKDADFQDGKMKIKKIIPEGRGEMDFLNFLAHLPEDSRNLLNQFL